MVYAALLVGWFVLFSGILDLLSLFCGLMFIWLKPAGILFIDITRKWCFVVLDTLSLGLDSCFMLLVFCVFLEFDVLFDLWFV